MRIGWEPAIAGYHTLTRMGRPRESGRPSGVAHVRDRSARNTVLYPAAYGPAARSPHRADGETLSPAAATASRAVRREPTIATRVAEGRQGMAPLYARRRPAAGRLSRFLSLPEAGDTGHLCGLAAGGELEWRDHAR